MPLKSELFTQPVGVPSLEACLVHDSAHITPGQHGEGVRRIQDALNKLSAGPGRPNYRLAVDGRYGPKTASAVQSYKNARRPALLQPWQTSADDIVGRRTLQSLDDEMAILEEESPGGDSTQYVCLTQEGPTWHDHSRCVPNLRLDPDIGHDGKISHMCTPINPQGYGRKIAMGGTEEARYVGFEDFVPDYRLDKDFPASWTLGRQVTSSLKASVASDIFYRSAPIDRYMQTELKRIAMPGCRLIYAGRKTLDADYCAYFHSLGPIIEQGTTFYYPVPANTNPEMWGMQYTVVCMLFVDGL